MASLNPLPHEELPLELSRRQVERAIEGRQVVKFEYDGMARTVQVVAVGWRESTRKFLLRGYQVGGMSRSGQLPEWRMFALDKVAGLIVTMETFEGYPEGYNRFGDSAMDVIYAKL